MPQLPVLALERLQALSLITDDQVLTLGLVGFGLADPAAQRLALDAEVLGDLGDRAVRFKREADASLPQLVGGTASVLAFAEVLLAGGRNVLLSESP